MADVARRQNLMRGAGKAEKKRSRAPASSGECPVCHRRFGAQGLPNHIPSCNGPGGDVAPVAKRTLVPRAIRELLNDSTSRSGTTRSQAASENRSEEKHNPFGRSKARAQARLGASSTTPSTDVLDVPDIENPIISAEGSDHQGSPEQVPVARRQPSPDRHTVEEGLPPPPFADDIKVETHPSSKLPPKVYSYEDYTADLPKPEPTVHKPSRNAPWFPFRSKLDFELAQFMQDNRFNNSQTDALLSLIGRINRDPKEFHLVDAKHVNELWDGAAFMHDASLKHETFRVPYKGAEIEFDLWFHDIWDWCLELLRDPFYVRQMRWHALRLYRHNGFTFERFINEPWTADDWWFIQSQLPEGALPFCIILYADKTKLSSMGTQKGYPVYVRCANLPIELRNGEGPTGARLVGLLPIVAEEAAESGKKGFVDFKRIVWHKGFELLLAKLKEYAATGCTVLCGDDIERLIIPLILILSADYEEQCVMAAIRGTNSLFPCPTCLAPLEEMFYMSKDFEPRTTRSMTEIYRSVLNKTRAIRDKVLQNVGLRDVKNVFWGLAYTDVYRALSWDRLHAYHGGLFSDHLLEQFLEILKLLPRKFRDEFEKQLDAFPRWRDLNHFREIAQFREFTDGRKYEDLSKIIIFAIHNILMDPEVESARSYQLLRLMRRYLELDMFSSLRNHNDATLALGRKALLDWERELKKYRSLHSGKDWNFPKAHTHKHLIDEIQRKGATRNSNTKTFEAEHPSMKKDFKRTNFVNVNPQLARFDARDYSSYLIQEQVDRAAARDEAVKSRLEQDRKELEGDQVQVSLQVATSDQAIPTHLTAGSTVRSLIKNLPQHFPPHFQDAFMGITEKIKTRLSVELGYSVCVDQTDMVTIYRYVKVDYASYEDATVATDYLRMNASFHSRERFDCGLFSVYGHSFVFAQMVAVLGVEVKGVEYLIALVLPYDEKLTGNTRTQQQRDKDLMFHRVRARPHKADSAVVLARTLVRGALLVPDFSEKWPGDEFLVMDVVDADMWLRMKDIRHRFLTRASL